MGPSRFQKLECGENEGAAAGAAGSVRAAGFSNVHATAAHLGGRGCLCSVVPVDAPLAGGSVVPGASAITLVRPVRGRCYADC